MAPNGCYERVHNFQAHLLIRDSQTDYIKDKVNGNNRSSKELVCLSDFAAMSI